MNTANVEPIGASFWKKFMWLSNPIWDSIHP